MIFLLPHPSHEWFQLYFLERKHRQISIYLNIPKVFIIITFAKTLIYTRLVRPTLLQEEEMGRSQTMKRNAAFKPSTRNFRVVFINIRLLLQTRIIMLLCKRRCFHITSSRLYYICIQVTRFYIYALVDIFPTNIVNFVSIYVV